jgi:hypothetical protein
MGIWQWTPSVRASAQRKRSGGGGGGGGTSHLVGAWLSAGVALGFVGLQVTYLRDCATEQRQLQGSSTPQRHVFTCNVL